MDPIVSGRKTNLYEYLFLGKFSFIYLTKKACITTEEILSLAIDGWQIYVEKKISFLDLPFINVSAIFR